MSPPDTIEHTMDPISPLGCMLIPASEVLLLLPNVCVAEILPWRELRQVPNHPVWCEGVFDWRGQVVPVISYVMLPSARTQEQASVRRPQAIVVLNALSQVRGLANYAMAVDALPRTVQVREDDLQPLENGQGQTLGLELQLEDATVIIPDLRALEAQLGGLSSFSA